MEEINIINGKMSTLPFAELTGAMHKNVLAKTRKLLKDLDILAAAKYRGVFYV
jgi:hypothetical protein